MSIIAALGESLGFIIFPSLVGYERVLHAAEMRRRFDGPIDMGTTMLALDFERGAELPDGMRKEIAKHGWPVAAAHAHPMVHRREADGPMRSDIESRSAAATACTIARVSTPIRSR